MGNQIVGNTQLTAAPSSTAGHVYERSMMSWKSQSLKRCVTATSLAFSYKQGLKLESEAACRILFCLLHPQQRAASNKELLTFYKPCPLLVRGVPPAHKHVRSPLQQHQDSFLLLVVGTSWIVGGPACPEA